MLETEALVTTYLEMRAAPEASRDHRSQVSGSQGANFAAGGREQGANRPREAGASVLGKTEGQSLMLRELKEPDWRFNRDMYFQVGEQWKWIDKRPWTDAQWEEYAGDPSLRTFAGYCGDQVAGYFELKRTAASPSTRDSEAEIEIAYFGLLPEFIGRGLGGELLGRAIETAWGWEPMPSRVWVHTCNRDHPSALKNYQARGFRVYKVERETRN